MSSYPSSEAVREAVRQVLAGDVDRYETIYRLTDGPLRAFVGRKYGYLGPDFVDEVRVRTHEEVCRRLAEYDPARAAFVSWMCWRARHVASLVAKSRYGRRYEPFDPDWFTGGPGPAEAWESSRRDRVIREEVGSLPEDLRRVIELGYFEGLSLQETADRLNLRVGGVRRRRARALKTIRQRLLERRVRVVERDSTPMPEWSSPDDTGYDDDWTATVGACLPSGPDPLAGRAERDQFSTDDTQ